MQFLVYILVYPIFWVISILPFPLLYAVSDLLYLLVYRLVGYRKKVVMDNLRLALPKKSEAERKEIARQFYHHFCDMMLETVKSLTISEKVLKERYKFTNIEVLQQLEAQGRSVVLMCGHYANWEWSFIMQRYIGFKGYAVYSKLANRHFDRLIKRLRAQYDSNLITTKQAVPTLLRAKVNGELTINGFVSDQSPMVSQALHWNEFMGIKVPIHTGAEILAKRLDMAVVFFAVKRISRGHYETTFEILAENPKEFPNYEISDIFMKKVEDQIYAAPQYYLWTHRRWKHRNKVPEKFR